jgi:hypothetical protein
MPVSPPATPGRRRIRSRNRTRAGEDFMPTPCREAGDSLPATRTDTTSEAHNDSLGRATAQLTRLNRLGRRPTTTASAETDSRWLPTGSECDQESKTLTQKAGRVWISRSRNMALLAGARSNTARSAPISFCSVNPCFPCFSVLNPLLARCAPNPRPGGGDVSNVQLRSAFKAVTGPTDHARSRCGSCLQSRCNSDSVCIAGAQHRRSTWDLASVHA